MAYAGATQFYVDKYLSDGDKRSSDLARMHEDYKTALTNADSESKAAEAKKNFYSSYYGKYGTYQFLDPEVYDTASETLDVTADGLYENISGSSDYEFSKHQDNVNLIKSKLDELKYGKDGSYHLEPVKDRSGNVLQPGIDELIANASGDEKAVLEAKKQQLSAEYEKWSKYYETELPIYEQKKAESEIVKANFELTGNLRDGASDDVINASAQSLAILEIQYFDKYESGSLTGNELAERQAYINGLKEAYPDYENVINSLKGSLKGTTSPSANLGDLRRSEYEGQTVKKEPWEKSEHDMTEADKRAYIEHYEGRYSGEIRENFASVNEADEYKKGRNAYVRYKQECGISLTDNDKRWMVSDFENSEPNINSPQDYQAYQAKRAQISQYKAELGIVDEAKTELAVETAEVESTVEMTETEVPLAETSEKPNPYAFEKPARSENMSDADYENMCKTAEQAHIAQVNNDMADAVIRGEYGVGQERIKALEAAGYDYSQVQSVVNEKMAAYQAQAASTQTAVASKEEPVIEKVTDIQRTSHNSVNEMGAGKAAGVETETTGVSNDKNKVEFEFESGATMDVDMNTSEFSSNYVQGTEDVASTITRTLGIDPRKQRQALEDEEPDDISRKESKPAETKSEDVPKSETNELPRTTVPTPQGQTAVNNSGKSQGQTGVNNSSKTQGQTGVNVNIPTQGQTGVEVPHDDKLSAENDKGQTAGQVKSKLNKTDFSMVGVNTDSGKTYSNAPDPFDN